MEELRPPNLVQLIFENIQEGIDSEQSSERFPGTYRGSELGKCARAIQYTVLNTEREKIDPQLALLFRDGDLHHDDLRSLLSRVGTLTNVEQGATGKFKTTVKGKEYEITLTITPDMIFNRDYIVDIKSINRFSFKYLSKDWVLTNKKEYVIQINTYMKLFKKAYGCLLFKCKDTSELKQMWFPFDEELWQETLQKLAFITYAVDSKVMIKRPFRRGSKECGKCNFFQTCWSGR